MALNKFRKRMILSRSGRVPWTRRELEEWLRHLNETYVDSEGDWDSIEESMFFLHRKYGGKAMLWIGRVMAIINFMHKFRPRLRNEGLVAKGNQCELLSESLLDALAKLPITNPSTGFSYKTVHDYIERAAKPN